MLHMIVMTHGPETCAAVSKASGDMARFAMSQLDDVSKKLDCAIKGAWVDPPAHAFYILADAPNAHVINQAMQELKFMLWNTIDIHPIVTLEDAMGLAAR